MNDTVYGFLKRDKNGYLSKSINLSLMNMISKGDAFTSLQIFAARKMVNISNVVDGALDYLSRDTCTDNIRNDISYWLASAEAILGGVHEHMLIHEEWRRMRYPDYEATDTIADDDITVIREVWMRILTPLFKTGVGVKVVREDIKGSLETIVDENYTFSDISSLDVRTITHVTVACALDLVRYVKRNIHNIVTDDFIFTSSKALNKGITPEFTAYLENVIMNFHNLLTLKRDMEEFDHSMSEFAETMNSFNKTMDRLSPLKKLEDFIKKSFRRK